MAYVAGRSIESLRRDGVSGEVVKLGSNENPLGPSPRAAEALVAGATTVHLYPGVELAELRAAIATHAGLGVQSVVVGNGSCDVLTSLAARVLSPGDEAVVPEPAFAMYRIGAEAAGATVITVPHRDYALDLACVRDAISPRTKLVYLANPNNPTGMLVSESELTDLLDDLPARVLLVVDEAYNEYVDEAQGFDGVELLRRGRNVIVTRTFSKIYGLAGMRVGYGLAAPELVGRIAAAQPPFHTGGLALRAARAALADVEHVERSACNNREGRHLLSAELAALGLRVLPSQANHVLVVDLEDVEGIDHALCDRGIIVRPTGPSFGLEGGLRVTVGTPAQNRSFLAALRDVLAERSVPG